MVVSSAPEITFKGHYKFMDIDFVIYPMKHFFILVRNDIMPSFREKNAHCLPQSNSGNLKQYFPPTNVLGPQI